jgi:uncharacterized protein (TIGR02145 family)
VDKTVIYNTVTNLPGEPAKCWITSNLGSTQQAWAEWDNSEGSAGWYWQFNRKQGFKHDGTNRTPNTTWIYSISENSDWLSSNDPCTIELGAAWRIPTNSEWNNVFTGGTWNNWNSPWYSPLRIHAAGRLNDGTSQLVLRGSLGAYWSSVSYNNGMGHDFSFFSNNNYVGMGASDKPSGFPVRCLYVLSTLYAPSVTTAPIITITQTTAISGGTVTSDGGATVTARGICWDTIPNPTINGNHTTEGIGTGTYQSFMNSLSPNSQYYVRAYAVNDIGTSYGNEVSFTTLLNSFNCSDSISYNNQVYHSVLIGTQCWLKENLNIGTMVDGNTAQSDNGIIEKYCYDNLPSNCNIYGGLYQWPEMMQYAVVPSSKGICPDGWHIPTDAEQTLLNTFLGEFVAGGKMKETGFSHWLAPNTGATNSSGFTALPAGVFYWPGLFTDLQGGTVFWTSTALSSPGSAYRRALGYNSEVFYRNDAGGTMGYSVRCINNSTYPVPISVTTSPVSNVTANTAMSGGNVNSYNGAPIISKGICYGVNAGISLAGMHTHDGAGQGAFVSALTELLPDKLYFIRAYAETSTDTIYGNQLAFNTSPWNCGSSVSIHHRPDDGISPVEKITTYSNVTNIPGEPSKCWLSSNFGSDHQAIQVDDTTEASAGWYWQFNRQQGYKQTGSGIIPGVLWVNSINESTDWQASQDPCSLVFGFNWRLPTNTEWINVDAGNSWVDWFGPWNSDMKLHAAGFLESSNGTLMNRGSIGLYWSSTMQTSQFGWNLRFTKLESEVISNSKAFAMPVRCIKN